MLAYCPRCKKRVSVMTIQVKEEALKTLKENKLIKVMHVGPDGDHVFETGNKRISRQKAD
jgi:hypothetical protein